MKLIINVSNNLGGGGLQVALSFIYECRKYPENDYHVFCNPDILTQIDQKIFDRNFVFYHIPVLSRWILGRYLSKLEKRIHPDSVFTVFGPSYWRPKVIHLMGYAYGHYIYPESVFMKKMPLIKQIRVFVRKRILFYLFTRQADALVTETLDAEIRLKRFLKVALVYTVSNTCSTWFSEPEIFSNKLPLKRQKEFRLLTISAYYPHKNLGIIPLVVEELLKKSETEIRFVLTLSCNDYKKIIPQKYRTYVYNVGPIKNKECPSLYKECDVMFLPTFLECFSASYPEAMKMGKPILTSDLGFAHSICDKAALYFPPDNPTEIADIIVFLYKNPIVYENLKNNGYKRIKEFPTAAQRAHQYLSIVKNLYLNSK